MNTFYYVTDSAQMPPSTRKEPSEEYYFFESPRFNRPQTTIHLTDQEIRTFAKRIADYITRRTFAGTMESFDFQIEYHGVAVQGRYTVETERQGAVHSMGMTEWIDVPIREETSIASAWCTATDEEVPRVLEKLNELLK